MARLRCGLLGEKLSHSFSPKIHAEFGDYEYRLFEKPQGELEDFLHKGDFDALNVTIPYKKDVIAYCAELSKTAQAIGSVNTITRLADGSLRGDNTDYFGFAYLLDKAGVDVSIGKTLVLGSGGSSLTVQAVLRDRGAKEAVIISRHPGPGADTYENISKHSDAILLVNTTPVGMYPNNGVSPVSVLDGFSECQAVIDLIYNPARTKLVLDAETCGIRALSGLAMLTAQAAKASECFTGTPIPDEQIEAVLVKISRMTQNIVLIGMPGCGKTTIGAALAQKMGREFIDIDDEIVEIAGKPISDIFASEGEETFRVIEKSVLEKFCKESELVIATGGGVVTQPENRNILRQNGIIIFLDREISELPTDGRPVSQRDGIEKLAATRMPQYKQWSEMTVAVNCVEESVEKIIRNAGFS